MEKKIILTIIIATFLTIMGCRSDKKEQPKDAIVKIQKNRNPQNDSLKREDTLTEDKKDPNINPVYTSKSINIENALINGHKVILSKTEFDAIYPKNDSVKTTLWECGNPFEWLDKEWMIKKYGPENKEKGTFERFNSEITTIYLNKIEYNTNNHLVLFDRASAENNSFKIISQNITLDRNTTLEGFKKIFPNAEIEKLANKNEVRARFSLGEKRDDAFLFYFKNGKLNYFTLWWLLC